MGRTTTPTRTAHLRAMQPEDHPRLLTLWERCQHPIRLPADSYAGIARFLGENPDLSVVAELEGELVAAALCGEDGRAGFIHSLVVSPGHAAQRLDRAIIRRCLLHLRALGITTCHLLGHGGSRSVQLGAHAETGLGESVTELAGRDAGHEAEGDVEADGDAY